MLPVVLSSLIAAAAFFVGLYCYISPRRRRKRKMRGEIVLAFFIKFSLYKFCSLVSETRVIRRRKTEQRAIRRWPN